MTDRPTDQPTDRPTDKAGCRVACTRLKKMPKICEEGETAQSQMFDDITCKWELAVKRTKYVLNERCVKRTIWRMNDLTNERFVERTSCWGWTKKLADDGSRTDRRIDSMTCRWTDKLPDGQTDALLDRITALRCKAYRVKVWWDWLTTRRTVWQRKGYIYK